MLLRIALDVMTSWQICDFALFVTLLFLFLNKAKEEKATPAVRGLFKNSASLVKFLFVFIKFKDYKGLILCCGKIRIPVRCKYKLYQWNKCVG